MRDPFFHNPSHPFKNLTSCYPHIQYQLDYNAKAPSPTKPHPSFCPKAMSINLIIRPAALPDAAAIANVHITARQETYRGMIPNSKLDAELDVSARETSWISI